MPSAASSSSKRPGACSVESAATAASPLGSDESPTAGRAWPAPTLPWLAVRFGLQALLGLVPAAEAPFPTVASALPFFACFFWDGSGAPPDGCPWGCSAGSGPAAGSGALRFSAAARLPLFRRAAGMPADPPPVASGEQAGDSACKQDPESVFAVAAFRLPFLPAVSAATPISTSAGPQHRREPNAATS